MDLPYFVTWYLPGRVIYARIQRQLEGEEPAQVDQHLCNLLDEGERAYLIMDLRDVAEMKNPSLARLDHVTYRHHPNLQWMLILTTDQVMHFLSTAVSQMAHKSYRVFSDTGELILFLKKNLTDADWNQVQNDYLIAE